MEREGRTSETPLPRCEQRGLLKGQSALVTGASSGIGRGIALALARAGASVCVNYRSGEERAREVVSEIESAGGRAFAHGANVSDEGQVREMFQRTIDAFGTVDILINNAGIQKDAPFHEMTIEQWNQVITTNLTGQFLCAREAIVEFLRRGVCADVSCSAGKIAFMSSVHDEIPWAGHANYAASKGGIDMLMRTLAQEVAPQRIRVNSIAPGAIRTRINEPEWSDPESHRRMLELIPYGRIGEVDDVGRLAAWLVSDEADYIIGQSLYIDGGMTLYPGFAHGG